jgi:hypothetical protein
VALRADASRVETEEMVGALEERLDHAEHSLQLLQHAVHLHDERIASLMYSPARNAVAVRPRSAPAMHAVAMHACTARAVSAECFSRARATQSCPAGGVLCSQGHSRVAGE